MKKFYTLAVVALAGLLMMASCGTKSGLKGYKVTENGLFYKFDVVNETGEQPQEGDVLVGEITIRLDTAVLVSTSGHVGRILQVTPSAFKGDLNEGLKMMHKGEKATFAIEADSLANFFQQGQMPPQYVAGNGQKFYYEISLADIVSKDELAQEQANYIQEMSQRETEEPGLIKQYVAEKNITVKPTEDGLYVIINKKGNGPKVAAGRTVQMDYTGRLLDGTIFDSSREADAKAAGKYTDKREYKPLEYVVGQMALISGWDKGVMGLPEGTEVTLIIPSKLGYGARGAGNDIPAYSPLVFDITIVSVK